MSKLAESLNKGVKDRYEGLCECDTDVGYCPRTCEQCQREDDERLATAKMNYEAFVKNLDMQKEQEVTRPSRPVPEEFRRGYLTPTAAEAIVRRQEEREVSKPTNPKDILGSDKLPLHLFPLTAVAYGSVAMLEGLLKYGRSNFRAIGVRASIYKDALDRHMNAWMEGEDIDPDSGLPHLAKALACIAILIEATEIGNLNDDRNYPGGYHKTVRNLTPHVKRLKAEHRDKNPRHYTIMDAKVREGK